MDFRTCLFTVLFISLGGLGGLNAQTTTPRIVDTLVHYNLGHSNDESAFLEKLLAKLDSVDGMALLLPPPKISIPSWASSSSIPSG